jgi:hypothetical protein
MLKIFILVKFNGKGLMVKWENGIIKSYLKSRLRGVSNGLHEEVFE